MTSDAVNATQNATRMEYQRSRSYRTRCSRSSEVTVSRLPANASHTERQHCEMAASRASPAGTANTSSAFVSPRCDGRGKCGPLSSPSRKLDVDTLHVHSRKTALDMQIQPDHRERQCARLCRVSCGLSCKRVGDMLKKQRVTTSRHRIDIQLVIGVFLQASYLQTRSYRFDCLC
jgi:hypothetical protein